MPGPVKVPHTARSGLDRLIRRSRDQGVGEEADLPFLRIPGKKARGTALLVHGFTATPQEMHPFADRLAADGFFALGVRLPGHGTTPADLATRSHREWLAAVDEGWSLAEAIGLPVCGVGLSTGALLLAQIACLRPLWGLVLLSPFLRLQHRLAPLAGLLSHVKDYQERPPEETMADYYYRHRPLHGVAEIRKLAGQLRSDLGGLQVPTLVLAGGGDKVVDVESGLEFFRRIGSDMKEYHRFGPSVGHVLATAENPYLERTLQLSLDFLSTLFPPSGT